MPKPCLHLDADTSSKALQKALQERGHDVTRTPINWMPEDASDEMQLSGAAARGRCIFTYNIGDFVQLAQAYPEHHGILFASQRKWTLSALIVALDRMLTETEADDWIGQTRWLNEWRK
jgi:hypothetical protein